VDYRHIQIERRGAVFCVRLKHRRLDEMEIYQFGEELAKLVSDEGCRRLALSLGPDAPDCMYSVFLAKLVGVRNIIRRSEGALVLCDVAPVTFRVFEACALNREFPFVADFAAAVAWFAKWEEDRGQR